MTIPKIIERPVQVYVGIPAELTLAEVAKAVEVKFATLFAWLAARRLEPSGPPFLRYLRVEMAKTLDVEYGVPIAASAEAAGGVRSGTLPAGRYAVLLHEGLYEGLGEANAALVEWAEQQDIALDSTPTPAGERFACRLETYLTDPRKESNLSKWQTEVAIKLR
jgi:effector-binding domain-containing protein